MPFPVFYKSGRDCRCFVLCTDILKIIILEEPYDPRAAPKEKRLQHERRPDARAYFKKPAAVHAAHSDFQSVPAALQHGGYHDRGQCAGRYSPCRHWLLRFDLRAFSRLWHRYRQWPCHRCSALLRCAGRRPAQAHGGGVGRHWPDRLAGHYNGRFFRPACPAAAAGYPGRNSGRCLQLHHRDRPWRCGHVYV